MSNICLITRKHDGNETNIMSRFVRHWYAYPLLDAFELTNRKDMPGVMLIRPSVIKLQERLEELKTDPEPIRKALRERLAGDEAKLEAAMFEALNHHDCPAPKGALILTKTLGEDAVISMLLGRLSDFVGRYAELMNAGEEPEIMV